MEAKNSNSHHKNNTNGVAARRPESADYHPSVWGDYFVKQHFPPSTIQKSEAWIKQKVEELVIEVKTMLEKTSDQFEEMKLIDALQRLGVAYHFETEIDEALGRIHKANNDNVDDLHFISLRFRLLRQHGYNTPVDVFNKFKDEYGNFESSLSKNVRSLLSLYEATYLSIRGEDTLNEALAFAKGHLAAMEDYLEPPIAALVSHALQTPLRRKLQRLESRQYIDIYENDIEVRNDCLLALAKLDFHLLQLLHREEVKNISEWWISLGLVEKLTFARDRVVECYFWILGVYYEPHYSRARTMTTKVTAQLSLMDDIYDAYGTLDELQLYTRAVERWNLIEVDQLEECMKLQYLALYKLAEDIENELAQDHLQYRVHYLKETIKNTCRGWLKEAEWREEGYVPLFEEYFSVSLPSTAYPTLACVSLVGMGEEITKEALEWIFGIPKIVKTTSTIARCRDDVVSSELEKKRHHVATGIQCYMKEHEGASCEDACKVLLEMVENGWKDINEECLNHKFPMHLLTRALNFSRVMEALYKDIDSYTHSSTTLKDTIILLLVQPISFEC